MYGQWCSSETEIILHCHEQRSLLHKFPTDTANTVAKKVVLSVGLNGCCGCQTSGQLTAGQSVAPSTYQHHDHHSTSGVRDRSAPTIGTSGMGGISSTSGNVGATTTNATSRGFFKMPLTSGGGGGGNVSNIPVQSTSSVVDNVHNDPSSQFLCVDQEEEVSWLMQVINYALTMPLAHIEVLKHAAHIYICWLGALLPKPHSTIPTAIVRDPNRYARDIIYSLVNLFTRKQCPPPPIKAPIVSDKKDESSRREDSTQLPTILHAVLKAIENLAIDSTSLQPETWECLLHFCLAVCHHVFEPTTDSSDFDMDDRLLEVIIKVWLHASASCFPRPSLWRSFTELAQQWRHRRAVVRAWCFLSAELSKLVLHQMYGMDYPVDLLQTQSRIQIAIPLNLNETTVKECWIRLLHLLSNPVDICHLQTLYRPHNLFMNIDNRTTGLTSSSLSLNPIYLNKSPTASRLLSDVPGGGVGGSGAGANFASSTTNPNLDLQQQQQMTLDLKRLAIIFYDAMRHISRLCDAFLGFRLTLPNSTSTVGTPLTQTAGGALSLATSLMSANVGGVGIGGGGGGGQTQSQISLIKPNVKNSNKLGGGAATGGGGGASGGLNAAGLRYENSPPENRRDVVTGRFKQAVGAKTTSGSSAVLEKSKKKTSSSHIGSTMNLQSMNELHRPGGAGGGGGGEHGGVNLPGNTSTSTMSISSWATTVSSAPPTIWPNYFNEQTINNQLLHQHHHHHSNESSILADALLRRCSGLDIANITQPHANRPEAGSILHLFALWLFEAAVTGVKLDMNNAVICLRASSIDDKDFQFGRAEACGALCRIICTARHMEDIKPYLTRFYMALHYGLAVSQDSCVPNVVATIMYNSVNLLRVDLEGVFILIPRILAAVQKILTYDSMNPFWTNADFLSPILLRRTALHQLLSTVCLSSQFKELSIKSLLPVAFHLDDPLPFQAIRKKILILLFHILEKEKDPINLQMTLGLTLAWMEDFILEESQAMKLTTMTTNQKNEKVVDNTRSGSAGQAFNQLIPTLGYHILQTWANDLSTTFFALEILSGLAQWKPKGTDPQAIIRCVRTLCEFINAQCRRDPKDHSRFLHSIIVMAYQCLSVWMVYHSYLLKDSNCLDRLLSTIELGLTGSSRQSCEVYGITQQSTAATSTTTTSASSHPRHGSPGSGLTQVSTSRTSQGSASGNAIIINNTTSTTNNNTTNLTLEDFLKATKRQKPTSMRVQHAAEALLACMMEQAGAHPTPAGASVSQCSLLDETTLLYHVKENIYGGQQAMEEFNVAKKVKSFRYYWVEPGLIMGLLEVNENFDKSYSSSSSSTSSTSSLSPCLLLIIRGMFGRHAWCFSPQRLSTNNNNNNQNGLAANKNGGQQKKIWPNRPEALTNHSQIIDSIVERLLTQDGQITVVEDDPSIYYGCAASLNADPFLSKMSTTSIPKLEHLPESQLKDVISMKNIIHQQENLIKNRNKINLPNPIAECRPPEQKREFQTARLLLTQLGYLSVNFCSPSFLEETENRNINLTRGGGGGGGVSQAPTTQTIRMRAAAGGVSIRKPSYEVSSGGGGGGGGGEDGSGFTISGGDDWNLDEDNVDYDGGGQFHHHQQQQQQQQQQHHHQHIVERRLRSREGNVSSSSSGASQMCSLDSSTRQFYDQIHQLDAIGTRSVETVHCFYMKSNQSRPEDIVANMNPGHFEQLPSQFHQFLLSLGWIVKSKEHAGWGGTSSALGLAFQHLLTNANTLTANEAVANEEEICDGRQSFLYWSDFSVELAFICVNSLTWMNRNRDEHLDDTNDAKVNNNASGNSIRQRSESDGQDLCRNAAAVGGGGGGAISKNVSSSAQRQSLFLPDLPRLSDASGNDVGKESLANEPRTSLDSSLGATASAAAAVNDSSSSLQTSSTEPPQQPPQQQQPSSAPQPTTSSSHLRSHQDHHQQQQSNMIDPTLICSSHMPLAIVWMESKEDLERCPIHALLSGGFNNCGGRFLSPDSTLNSLIIYILPLRSGLYRVEIKRPPGKTFEAASLVSGMVLNCRCLASLIRHTVQNVTRRRRLETDTVLPAHVRRGRKIEEIKLRSRTPESNSADLYLGLFHCPISFTEPRF